MSFSFDSTKQLVVVKVRIVGPAGGATLNLAIDTGASATVIGWDSLGIVGYEPADAFGKVQMTTGSKTEIVPKIKLKQIVALGKRRQGLEILAHSLPKGASVDGLLGLDFFRRYKLTIDFRKSTVKLG